MHNVMYSEVGSDMSLEIVAITLKKFPQKKIIKIGWLETSKFHPLKGLKITIYLTFF